MKKTLLSATLLLVALTTWAGIDMQAHIDSDEGQAAYTDYKAKQNAYYTGSYSYATLAGQTGETLFGSLNTLMGNTSKIGGNSFSYNTLRDSYINVDRDLNADGKIIGYYDGTQMNGTWGNGYNREHTWPQSKGANKSTAMGHDMQSVRPTNTAVNSDRGNDAYGESSGYYDPNEIEIDNTNYKKTNLGTYRGDCARVILYDYVVYGQMGSYKNSLYIGNAQLLSKLGSDGVFESLAVLLKWHMQDPPSLTEMVRNDGAADYQGNRNPFIDYPELAINMLKNQSGLTTYSVTTNTGATLYPRYTCTTSAGFVGYLTYADGTHPTADQLSITGGTFTYDATLGRLIVSSVSKDMVIKTTNDPTLAVATTALPEVICYTTGNSTFCVNNLPEQAQVAIFDCAGRTVELRSNCNTSESFSVPRGIYLVRVQANGQQRTMKIAI